MNRFGKEKKKWPLLRSIVLPVLLFGALTGAVLYGVNNVTRTAEAERMKSVQTAVTRAVVQYYALEGQYPASLEVLEETYGLTIDHNRYLVDYRCFAANLMPDITVLEKEALGT